MFCNNFPNLGFNRCLPECFFAAKDCESRNKECPYRQVVYYPFYSCQPCLSKMWTKMASEPKQFSEKRKFGHSSKDCNANYEPAKKKQRSMTVDSPFQSSKKKYFNVENMSEINRHFPDFDFPRPIKVKLEKDSDDELQRKEMPPPPPRPLLKKKLPKMLRPMPKFVKEKMQKKLNKEKKKTEENSLLWTDGWYSRKYGKRKFGKSNVVIEKIKPQVLLEIARETLKPAVPKYVEEPEPEDYDVFPVKLWSAKDSIPLKPFTPNYVQNWLGDVKKPDGSQGQPITADEKAPTDELKAIEEFIDSVSMKSVEQIIDTMDEEIIVPQDGSTKILIDDSMEVDEENRNTLQEYTSLLQIPKITKVWSNDMPNLINDLTLDGPLPPLPTMEELFGDADSEDNQDEPIEPKDENLTTEQKDEVESVPVMIDDATPVEIEGVDEPKDEDLDVKADSGSIEGSLQPKDEDFTVDQSSAGESLSVPIDNFDELTLVDTEGMMDEPKDEVSDDKSDSGSIEGPIETKEEDLPDSDQPEILHFSIPADDGDTTEKEEKDLIVFPAADQSKLEEIPSELIETSTFMEIDEVNELKEENSVDTSDAGMIEESIEFKEEDIFMNVDSDDSKELIQDPFLPEVDRPPSPTFIESPKDEISHSDPPSTVSSVDTLSSLDDPIFVENLPDVTIEEERILLEEDTTLLTDPLKREDDPKVEEIYFNSTTKTNNKSDPLEVDPLHNI